MIVGKPRKEFLYLPFSPALQQVSLYFSHIQAATGEEVSAEELGGADLHCRVSGSTDYYVEGYDEAIQTVRDIVHLHSDLFPGWSLLFSV